MKIAILECPALLKRGLLKFSEKNELELNIKYIDPNKIESNNVFDDFDAVINPLGSYFAENSVRALITYYNNGGIIFNLGPRAFTVPYYMENSEIRTLPETVDLIRTFGMIDSYIPYEEEKINGTVEICNENYEYLKKYFNSNEGYFKEVCATDFNLARNPIDEKYNSKVFVHNVAEPLIKLVNEKGENIATLISKTVELDKGTIYNFHFDTGELFNSDNGKDLLVTLINNEVTSNIYVFAEPEFARYKEKENINILLQTYIPKKSEISDKVHVNISILNQEYIINNDLDKGEKVFEKNMSIKNNELERVEVPQLAEGTYRVEIKILEDSRVLYKFETGFYVLEDSSLKKAYKGYSRMIIDNNISTEFHVQNGKVCPIHGTTYFVSDAFRKCFLHMNAFRCAMELSEIKNEGYNVIRTGIWEDALEFYGENGELNERGVRALEVLFYTAVKNNLTVQMVLGHSQINNWNLEKSVVHDKETRKKCMSMLCKFFKLFADYTNVQMDICNEPSYSRRGAWTIGRPQYDSSELKNFRVWLKNKYKDDIHKLRGIWGTTSYKIEGFDDIELPTEEYFSKQYNRTERYRNYAITADFFEFARESYSGWCREVRENGRNLAPEMVVLMGRDESIRIPCEQDEYLAKNIDTINWHQWSQNAIIFTEYLLSKVPGSICCAQEMGVYQFEDHRGKKVLSPRQIAYILERKLLYSLGNFVQWQWTNDPFMPELSENIIGINRFDGPKTLGTKITSELGRKEYEMAKYMGGREFSKTKILLIHPTSCHFSADSKFGEESARAAIDSLVYKLKQHIYVILEHTLENYGKYIQDGGYLFILPSAYILQEKTWKTLKEFVSRGNSVLITGSIEKDEYYLPIKRIREIDEKMKCAPLNPQEIFKINNRKYNVSFKKIINQVNSQTIFEKCIPINTSISEIHEFNMGEGKIYYLPLPIEICDQFEMVSSVYDYIIKKTKTHSTIFEMENISEHTNMFIYPQKFKECTVYTLVNEGERDTVSFKDLTSNKIFTVTIETGRGCKLWISSEGEILKSYGIYT